MRSFYWCFNLTSFMIGVEIDHWHQGWALTFAFGPVALMWVRPATVHDPVELIDAAAAGWEDDVQP